MGFSKAIEAIGALGSSGGGESSTATNTTSSASGGGTESGGSESGGSSSTSSAGSGETLIGGALDSLGLSVGSWVDRMQAYNMAEEQMDINEEIQERNFANIDREFDENKRRWGLDFALREYALRKGIALQQAQSLFGMLQNRQGLQAGQLQLAAQRDDRVEQQRRKKLSTSFLKGFSSTSIGGK